MIITTTHGRESVFILLGQVDQRDIKKSRFYYSYTIAQFERFGHMNEDYVEPYGLKLSVFTVGIYNHCAGRL